MGSYIATISPGEAVLLERIRTQEEGAFRELLERFGDRIYRTALRILREEQAAQDALQETFLIIHRAIRQFRGDSRIGTWINRITVNVCLGILRQRKKEESCVAEDVSELGMLPAQSKDPLEELCSSELRDSIERSLQKIGHKQREVLRLHDLEEKTIAEIAILLNLSEGTVKSRLFYGRLALKKVLVVD
ncbi:MAG: sigma-70 family RNA polymerase sigma factor [Acidobacteria bacterium]|nr:sigma-70 family RNA polymerase sigma factor [Acidobacteriota bacterium]